jgi:peptidoglycan-associated lipoprotein
MKTYIPALVASLLLFACTTSTKPPEAPKPAPPPPQASVQQPAPEKPKVETAPPVAEMDVSQLIQQLKRESIYFDFDKSVVKPEFTDIVKEQADFMLVHQNDIVTLEGNCDERGTVDYNLALGQRRADSVSHQLQLLGVPKQQIKTISYGKGKPRSLCHNESCWKDNRRVDFVHQLSQ